MTECMEFPWLSFWAFLGLVALAVCGAYRMGQWSVLDRMLEGEEINHD